MNQKLIILFLMISFPFFSFGQKLKLETIKSKIKYYEFNNNRDKIFMLDYDNKFHIYNTQNKSIKSLFEGNVIEADNYLLFQIDNPMFCTTDDVIYIVGVSCIYRIKNECLDSIPFLYEEYRYGAITSETMAQDEINMEKFNNSILNYGDDMVYSFFDQVYLMEFKNTPSVAFYKKTINDRLTKKEVHDKIIKLERKLDNNTDTSYSRNNKGKQRTYNYFEDKTISIKERSWFCNISFEIMNFSPPKCWYKIKIKSPNGSKTLTDRTRKQRAIYRGWGNGRWNCGLYETLPSSKRITDKDGNIYLLFYFKNEQKLIKLYKK